MIFLANFCFSGLVLGQDELTARIVWEYRETPDFYSPWGADADRLPNGNTLITDCTNGRILEVTTGGQKVWEIFFKGTPLYGGKYPLYRSERVLNLDLAGSILYDPDGWDTPYDISVTLWEQEMACNGITFVSAWGYLWGVNMTGDAVWKYEGHWMEQKFLDNSHLLLWGWYDGRPEIREIDLDGNLVFIHRQARITHDVLKISDDEIMYLFYVKRSWFSGPKGDEIRVMNIHTKKVVWRWNPHWHLPWDQYCPQCRENDWTHSNSITFAVEDDHPVVYLDVRNLNQIIKIDYETKRIIWKLGEKGDFKMFEKDGTKVAKLFSHQHDPEILPNGNILLFDNGKHRGGPDYSRVIEIEITK